MAIVSRTGNIVVRIWEECWEETGLDDEPHGPKTGAR